MSGDRAADKPARRALGFIGNRLVRGAEGRDATSLDKALAHEDARVFVTTDGAWLCRTDGDGGDAVPGFDAVTARRLVGDLGGAILLGHDRDGRPVLAAAAAGPVAEAGLVPLGLRALAMGGQLDADTEGQLGQAEHFLNWHARSKFCGRCGAATLADAAGYRRRCPACGDILFPRTDPVSIMLIHDGRGRCILGRQPQFPPKMWSCLAGFIEPGETLENAVRRETLEEAGIEVGRVDYVASQPWPFPGSLMIGCIGVADSFDIAFDGEELEDCRWFDKAEVTAMLEERHPDGLAAPKPFAIAHRLVRTFVEG